MPEITVHSLPVEPTVVAALRAIAATGTPLSTDHATEVMRDSYRNYVQQNTPRFRTLFAHLLEDRAPLVIHCTAGKDRTGFACALILHTLGVPDEVISEDYLLTNRFYRRDPVVGSDLPDDVKQVLGSVQASFLGAAFEAIDADYGDLETLSPRRPRARRGRTRRTRGALSRGLIRQSFAAAASISASRSAMTSSNAEIACWTAAICINSQPLTGPLRFCSATTRSRRCSLS